MELTVQYKKYKNTTLTRKQKRICLWCITKRKIWWNIMRHMYIYNIMRVLILYNAKFQDNIYRVLQKFCDIFILHISRLEKMIKSWFCFEKMRRKKLYKNCIKRLLFTCSDGFPTLNMNNLHDSATSQRNKNVWKTFFVLHIFRIEKTITSWFFFWKMHRRKLYTSCMNKSLLQNKKRLPNIFVTLNTLGSSTIM